MDQPAQTPPPSSNQVPTGTWPTPPPTPLPIPPTQKSSPFLPTLVGLLIVIILGLSSYITHDKFFSSKTSYTTPSPTPITNIPSPSPNPTTNWRTVTKKFWSLKVPSTWNYLECSDDLLFVGPNINRDTTEQCAFDGSPSAIQVYRMDPQLSKIPGPESTEPSVSERKSLTIDGTPALQQREIILDGQGQGDRIVVYISHNGYSYIITLHNRDETSTFDQILQTFQFVEPAGSPTGKTCIIGGCSGQLCIDANAEPVATTCEWKEEYACYKNATCKVQTDGNCGWTQSSDLITCLDKYR